MEPSEPHAFPVEIWIADHFEGQRGILRRIAEPRWEWHLCRQRLLHLIRVRLQQWRVEQAGHDALKTQCLPA